MHKPFTFWTVTRSAGDSCHRLKLRTAGAGPQGTCLGHDDSVVDDVVRPQGRAGPLGDPVCW